MVKKQHKNGNRPVEYISYKVAPGTNDRVNHNTTNQILNRVSGLNTDILRISEKQTLERAESVRMAYLANGGSYQQLANEIGCTLHRAKKLLDGTDLRDITLFEAIVLAGLASIKPTGTRDIAKEVMKLRRGK